MPEGFDRAALQIRAIACRGDATRDISTGPGVIDDAGAISIPISGPGADEQVLVRFSYAPAGLPPTTWLSAPEPGRTDLAWPGSSPLAPGEASLTLRPSTSGFRFVNHFEASPLPLIENTFGIRLNAFGLCGGMSFAAADLFLAGRARPEADHPPPGGSPLYGYIYRRQSDSLGPLRLDGLRFARWMSLPEGTLAGTAKRTYDELGSLRAAIDAGRPAMLGLVYVSSADHRPVWNNHQVLAFGYQSDGEGSLTIRIYDPNFPGRDDVTIRAERTIAGSIADPAHPGSMLEVPGVRCRQFVGGRALRPVRGLFVMPYTPAVPPEDLSSIPPPPAPRAK
jgi:hypothetical protein